MPKYKFTPDSHAYEAAAEKNELTLLTPEKAKAFTASDEYAKLTKYANSGLNPVGTGFISDLANAKNAEAINRVLSNPYILDQLDDLIERGASPHVQLGTVKTYFDEEQRKWRATEPEVTQPLDSKDIQLIQNLKSQLMAEFSQVGELRQDYGKEIADARMLFTQLSKGDIGDSPSAAQLADDIRQRLNDAHTDVSALDPEGKKNAAEMDNMLKAITQVVDRTTMADFLNLKPGQNALDVVLPPSPDVLNKPAGSQKAYHR